MKCRSTAQHGSATVLYTDPSAPSGLAVDGVGDVFIADGVLKELPFNGSAYGAPVTVDQYLGANSSQMVQSVAVDGAGNIYVGESAFKVQQLPIGIAPSLSFKSTNVGSTSTDSPQTVTVTNVGNLGAFLTANPTYPANFPENSPDAQVCKGPSQLNEGNSCDVSVNFTPTTSGSLSGSVTVPYEDQSETPLSFSIQVSGTGVGTAPSVTLSPNPLAFPSQSGGTTSSEMQVTLTNSGNASLSITGITIAGANPTDFAIGTGTGACGTTLAASASCTIYVTFMPASATSFTATLQVADDAAGSPQTVTLTGTGTAAPAPAAVLSPTTVPFGSQTSGTTSAPMSVSLSNTGNATLNITGITIAGANPTDFAIGAGSNACATTLAASASCTIYVTFTPASATSFTATLQVADNATGSPQTAMLTGTGTAAAAPVAAISPATVPFGSLTAGTTSAPMAVTLSNTGNAALNITGITLAGANPTDFAISTGSNACATTLAANATCSIYITFTPASAASFTATLQVSDNATGSPQTSALTGTGTAPPAPAVTFSPTSIAFATITTGTTSAASSVTLTNTGNAALTITGITITGTNSTDFALATGDSACGSSLAAGASCIINVTFTPASAASFTASVSVADNASGSPQTVTLTGTGAAPPDFTVTASPASQSVTSGGSTTYTVTVASTGGSFDNAVSLSVTGLPSGATGTFSPASINPADGSGSSTLTVQTGATQTASLGSTWPLVTPLLTLLFFLPMRRWRKAFAGRILLLVAGLASLAAAAGISGCGGGFALPQTAQTYTLTITGASGSDTHSTTVQLTVQ